MATVEDVTVQIDADISKLRKELSTAQKKLKGFEKVSGKTSKGTKKLADSFKNAASSAAVLEGPLGGTAGRISTIGAALSRVNPAMILFGVTLSAAAIALKNSAGAASNLERQMFKLEAIVKSTGGAAGFNAEQLDEMARNLDRTTLASAATARDAVGLLATFRSIGGDIFPQTVELAQDLASVLGGDLRSATLQLGKALEDPIIGLTSLSRSGVTFTIAEKKVIRALSETGKIAEAQRLILKKLADQVGGTGVAEGAGLAGQADLLAFEWNNLMEVIGNSGPIQATTFVIKSMVSAITALRSLIAPTADEIFNRAIKLRESIKRDLAKDDPLADFFGGTEAREKQLAGLNEDIAKMEADRAKIIREADERQKAAKKLRDSEIAAAQRAAGQLELTKLIESMRTQEDVARAAHEARKLIINANVSDSIKADLLITKSAMNMKNELVKIEGTIEKAQADRKDGIDNIIDGLSEEIDVIGKSNRELLERELALLEVTDAQRKWILGLDDLREEAEKTEEIFRQLEDATQRWGDELASQIQRGKLDFGNLAESIISDLARIAIQQAIVQPLLDSITGSGLFTSVKNFFGGFFEHGGNPPVGIPSVVGEKGPELFIPSIPGTILPASDTAKALSRGDVIINQSFSIDARGSSGEMEQRIRQAVAEGAQLGYEAVAQDFVTNGPIRRSV